MRDKFFDRSKLRINSPMWGDAMFPYIERNEVSEATLLDISKEVEEWQVIFERLFKFSPAKIVDVAWNSRLSTTLVRCKKAPAGFRLEFNPTALALCTPTGFHEVIAHEVIHTLPGAFNHGRDFKRYAAILSNVTRVKVARVCADENVIAHCRSLREKRAAYEITCEKCGNVSRRERISNPVKHPENYRCAICGGTLKVTQIF